MGTLFGGNSSSSPTDNRIAATDQARVIGRGNSGVYTESGGLTQGKGASLQTGGNSVVDSGKGNTVVLNDPAAALKALDAIAAVSGQNSDALSAALQTSQQNQADLAQQITGIAAAQTGAPAANATPFVLYGGLALAGLVAFMLLRKH